MDGFIDMRRAPPGGLPRGTRAATTRHPSSPSPSTPVATSTNAIAVPWPVSNRIAMPAARVIGQISSPARRLRSGHRVLAVTSEAITSPRAKGQAMASTPVSVRVS